MGRSVTWSSAATCAATSSSVTPPSSRPSVNAKPELVVASALKPSASKTRAEPASQGFGMTKGCPSWSARKCSPFARCLATSRLRGVPEALSLGKGLELLQRVVLDLADALACDAEGLPNLFQRVRLLAGEPE